MSKVPLYRPASPTRSYAGLYVVSYDPLWDKHEPLDTCWISGRLIGPYNGPRPVKPHCGPWRMAFLLSEVSLSASAYIETSPP